MDMDDKKPDPRFWSDAPPAPAEALDEISKAIRSWISHTGPDWNPSDLVGMGCSLARVAMVLMHHARVDHFQGGRRKQMPAAAAEGHGYSVAKIEEAFSLLMTAAEKSDRCYKMMTIDPMTFDLAGKMDDRDSDGGRVEGMH